MSSVNRIGSGIRRGIRSLLIPASIILANGCANKSIVRPMAPMESKTTSNVAQCSSIDSAKDDKRLSIALTCSMNIENVSSAEIFYFFRNLSKYYLDISKGHRKFKLLNANSLRKGVFIEVEETAGGQSVKHKYQVVEVVENRFIKLISDPSMVEIWGGLFTVPVKTIVEFEIQSNTISSTLTLKFGSSFTHSMADLMGTRKTWEAHIKEEMENAAKIIRSDRFARDYELGSSPAATE